MDREPVHRAIEQLFKERELALTEAPISHAYIWGFTVKVKNEIVFSIDIPEEYVLRMQHEVGMPKFKLMLVDHICAEIQCSLGGVQTYTERNRVLN